MGCLLARGRAAINGHAETQSMMHLKIFQKLVVGFILTGAATALALAFLVRDRNEPIDNTAKERLGLAYLAPIRELRELVPQARRLDGSTPAAAEKQAALEQALARLDELDLRLGPTLGTTEDFVRLKKSWRQMKTADDGPADGSTLESGLRSLRAVVVDTSNLILDPMLDTFYLMDASVVALSNQTDLLDRLPDRSAARSDSRTRQREIAATLPLLRASLDTVESDLRVATEVNPALKAPLEEERKRFERTAYQLLQRLESAAGGDNEASGRDVEAAVTAMLTDSFRLYDAAVVQLDALLQQRIAEYTRQRNRDVGLVLMLFAIGAAGALWIGVGTARSLGRVTRALQRIARGETPDALATSADDEVGVLAAAV